MAKCEYLRICNANTTKGYFLSIEPARRFNFEWLIKRYPKVKIGYDAEYARDIIEFPNPGYESAVQYALVTYFCEDGWEPFAANGGDVHLRRYV